MPETAGTETTPTVVTEAAATAKPLGEVSSLAEFRTRRSEANAPAEEPKARPEAASEVEDGEETETPDAKAAASEAGKALAAKKKSLQGRIDEIKAENYRTQGERDAARKEAADLRAELAALKSGKPAETKPEARTEAIAADPDDPEPKVEDFDDYQKFVKAQARWEARQEFREQQAKAGRQRHETGIQQAQSRVADAGAKAHEDFDAVVTKFENEGGEYSPVAIDVICGHELGHEFAYRMAKDPALAKRINQAATPAAAVFEAGKLIAKIEADAERASASAHENEPPAPKKLSKAPAPIEKREGGNDSPNTPDPDRINSLAEFRRVRPKLVAA